jgi:hypothetical protein
MVGEGLSKSVGKLLMECTASRPRKQTSYKHETFIVTRMKSDTS